MASLLSYQVFITLAMVFVSSSSAQLSHTFYIKSCPNVFQIVEEVVRTAIQTEARMGASLLRLHFHDCFVNGCDGSILLDDTASLTGEKTATPNNNSVRGFEVIDSIKTKLEEKCPGVVSCADILAIAAMKSVFILGGPFWDTKLGRRDSRTANKTLAQTAIPSPASNLSRLIDIFSSNNLSKQDLVVLSGSHTIGQARCTSFRARIYNETTNIDSGFAKGRQANCPSTSGSGDNNLAPLDLITPTYFDNNYFNNLVQKKGLLHSDQELLNGRGLTDSFVRNYANNPNQFNQDFAAAMLKMGDISPLTGSNGEIRKMCRVPN